MFDLINQDNQDFSNSLHFFENALDVCSHLENTNQRKRSTANVLQFVFLHPSSILTSMLRIFRVPSSVSNCTYIQTCVIYFERNKMIWLHCFTFQTQIKELSSDPRCFFSLLRTQSEPRKLFMARELEIWRLNREKKLQNWIQRASLKKSSQKSSMYGFWSLFGRF